MTTSFSVGRVRRQCRAGGTPCDRLCLIDRTALGLHDIDLPTSRLSLTEANNRRRVPNRVSIKAYVLEEAADATHEMRRTPG